MRLFITALLLAGAAPVLAAPVSLADRPAEAVALDAGRKPQAVLDFAGFRAGDTVADIMPGAGYYAELIGRVVGPKGHVLAMEPPAFLADPKAMPAWQALMARQPNVELIRTLPGDAQFPKGLEGAFFHLTYHDFYWESAKYSYPRLEPAAVLGRLFTAMKRGGTVIVIDHVGVAGMDARAQADKTHRIDPALVRADFEKAGFRFVGASDVLKTAGDDPTKLVFDPAVRGRTDRFAYKFVKP